MKNELNAGSWKVIAESKRKWDCWEYFRKDGEIRSRFN